MSAKSNYLEGKLVEHVLRNVAYTSPSAVYLSLHTANPDEDGSGTEVSGNGYSRQKLSQLVVGLSALYPTSEYGIRLLAVQIFCTTAH